MRVAPTTTASRLDVRRLLPASLLAAVLLIVGIVTAIFDDSILMIAPLLLLLVLMTIYHLREGLWILSPVGFVALSYAVVAITGPLVSDEVAAGAGVSAALLLSPSEANSAYQAFLLSADAVLTGALVHAMAWPSKQPRVTIHEGVDFRPRQELVTAALLIGSAPVLLDLVVYGSGLLSRPDYIPISSGDPLGVAASTLALPGGSLLGWATQAARTRTSRMVAWLGLALYAAISFALASRNLAVLPIVASMGMVAAKPRGRGAVVRLTLGVALGILLLQVPLVLRASPSHGLIPYISEVSQDPTHFVATDFNYLASNVLFAFALTGAVGFGSAPLNISDLWVSLSPLPGQAVGWYDVAPSLRLNIYTPFNAIGELANYGWPVLAGFYLVVGLYIARLDRVIRNTLNSELSWLSLVLLGFVVLFVVLSLQYNLRSAVRIVYYAAALDAIMLLIKASKLLHGQVAPRDVIVAS